MKHIPKFEDFTNESLNESNLKSFDADFNDYINDMENFVTKAQKSAKSRDAKYVLNFIISKIGHFKKDVLELSASLKNFPE